MTTVWLTVAGGFGAVVRFVVDATIRRRLPAPLPWATFVINVSGSVVLGVVTGLVLFHGDPDAVRAVVGTGFCGGYTTFSTASFETVRLAQQGHRRAAAGYAVGTVTATVAAAGACLLALS